MNAQVVFYPQIGYMLSLAGPDIDVSKAEMLHAGLEYAFSSKSDSDQGEIRFYFRNQTTKEMDEKFGCAQAFCIVCTK